MSLCATTRVSTTLFLVYGWLKLDLKWVLKAELRKVPGVGIGCEKAGHIMSTVLTRSWPARRFETH